MSIYHSLTRPRARLDVNIKRPLLALSLCALCFAGGCEDQEKMQAIQKAADERIAEVERKAKDQVARAQEEMAALKVQLTQAADQAKAEAASALKDAQTGADQCADDAETAMRRAREAYKAEAKAKLLPISEDAREVRSKLAKAPAKLKTAVQPALKEIDGLTKDVQKDIAAFDKATLETLRATKQAFNEHLAKLKGKVNAAKAKLPKA
jgi:hypothetical protein